MTRHRPQTSALALILSLLLSSCGAEESVRGIEPIEADFVLSVFELQATAGGPCEAFSSIQGEALLEGGWRAVLPTQAEFLRVLDCRWEGEDMLFEDTGRLLGRSKNMFGWDLFSNRTTRGGLEYVVSGRGEGAITVGLRGAERVAIVDLEAQHQSSTHSLGGSFQYEGPWPEKRLLLMHRRVGERANAPWICVALELH